MAARAYDSLGFPIPVDFDPVEAGRPGEGFGPQNRWPGTNGAAGSEPPSPEGHRSRGRRPSPTKRPSAVKRLIVLSMLLVGVVPLAVGPALLPDLRVVVARWSLERARRFEVRDEPARAVAEVDRAIEWFGEDPEMLCLRAGLRLENRDPGGAKRDLGRAAELAPMAVEPLRIRAIVHASVGDADAAVADAEMACELAGGVDPQGINLRSYVRALVGRDLETALDEIGSVIETLGEPPPEYIDTRGYLLHLLGRHEEAVEDLETAIHQMRQIRRQVTLLTGRVDRLELARRLRSVDHALAVIIHHRGLALEALGRSKEAAEDFAVAARKGYDPGRGIF